jgi:hypothetical protein
MNATHRQKANARFWICLNGDFVKITIKSGESIEYSNSERTEEGYTSEWISWYHDGDRVVREYATRSRDCDGLFDTHGSDYSPLSDLHAFAAYGTDDPDVKMPEWRRLGYGQRDHTAESMGY